MTESISGIPGRSILQPILDPSTQLACDLVGMVKSRNSGDPTHRFQIAGLIVFLAGVDKALGLALEILYLTGRVDWKWLAANRSPEPGFVECGRGLTAKLFKIRELGLDLTALGWLVEIRNWYVHECSIYAGYRVNVEWEEPPRAHLRAIGPEVSTSGIPLAGIDAATIKTYSDDLARLLGSLLDQNDWSTAWRRIQQRLSELPADPEPELTRIGPAGAEVIHEIVTALNARFLGDGLSKIL